MNDNSWQHVGDHVLCTSWQEQAEREEIHADRLKERERLPIFEADLMCFRCEICAGDRAKLSGQHAMLSTS